MGCRGSAGSILFRLRGEHAAVRHGPLEHRLFHRRHVPELCPVPTTAHARLYDADGASLDTQDWLVGPGQQITREIWGIFNGRVSADAATLDRGSRPAPERFQLFASRNTDPMEFKFDGLPAFTSAASTLSFPSGSP